MTTTLDSTADRALKAKHWAMWALGDYPAVAIDVIPELGPALVAATGIRVGDRVRLGNPGITLELIQVVDNDGTPTQL